MAKFNEVPLKSMNLTSVKYVNENDGSFKTLYVVPVLTLKESVLADADARQEKKLWRKFEGIIKKFEMPNDVKLSESEDEPLNRLDDDARVVITDLTSISTIHKDRRNDLNLGLRFVDDSNMTTDVFSDTFSKKVSDDGITENIDFDSLQDLYNKTTSQLEQESKENENRYDEQQRIEKERREQEQREEEERRRQEEEAKRYRTGDLNLTEDSIESDDDDESDDENVDDFGNPINTNANDGYDDDYNDNYDDENYDEYEEPEIERLKRELRESIEAQVGQVYLDNLDIDLEGSHQDDSTYHELERLTFGGVRKTLNTRQDVIQQRRDELVESIYQMLLPRLWNEYNQAGDILNYESDMSEYHSNYNKLKEIHKKALADVETKADNRESDLNDKIEKEIEDEVKRVTQEIRARGQRDKATRIEEDIETFKRDEREKADAEFDLQIETLERDTGAEYDKVVSRLVDKLVEQAQPRIKEANTELKQERDKSANYINQLYDERNDVLQDRIQTVEAERVRENRQAEEKIRLEVDKRTVESQKAIDRSLQLEEQNKELQRKLLDFEEQVKNQNVKYTRLEERYDDLLNENTTLKQRYDLSVQEAFNTNHNAMMQFKQTQPLVSIDDVKRARPFNVNDDNDNE